MAYAVQNKSENELYILQEDNKYVTVKPGQACHCKGGPTPRLIILSKTGVFHSEVDSGAAVMANNYGVEYRHVEDGYTNCDQFVKNIDYAVIRDYGLAVDFFNRLARNIGVEIKVDKANMAFLFNPELLKMPR